MSGPQGPDVAANRIQVRGEANLKLSLMLFATIQAVTSLPCCQQSYTIQVLVRVRPPIGSEVNEELAVACSSSQEHVQASISSISDNLVLSPQEVDFHQYTILQVLVPERLGDKPQLPSHSGVKAVAKKFTLDACLDGSVSQARLELFH